MKKIICFCLLILASCSYLPDAQTLAGVIVEENRNTMVIRPADNNFSRTGLLFYPGGLVDSHVYQEMLSGIVRGGFAVMVVKMPANLAVFSPEAALGHLSDVPGVSQWVLAGHSLGGAMACSVVKKYPGRFPGLILMAAYPAGDSSLRDYQGAVLSLSAELDGLATPAKITASEALLPPPTWLSSSNRVYPAATGHYSVFYRIPGGVHAYFGTYGPQDGDGSPVITREQQHAEIVDYAMEFLQHNGWGL